MEHTSQKKKNALTQSNSKRIPFSAAQKNIKTSKFSKLKIHTKNILQKNDSKKSVILKLVSSNVNSKIKIKDNTKLSESEKAHAKPVLQNTKLLLKPDRRLAVLSPFRFPLPKEYFVTSLARYAGVTFVVLGGLFSLLNIPFISNTALTDTIDVHNTAQNIGATLTVLDTENGNPIPKISIESPMPFNDIVPVSITVPNADIVSAIVTHPVYGELLLGNAIKVDATTWRLNWDTNNYPDGQYFIKVIVKNSQNTKQHTDNILYTVDHNPSLEETASTTSLNVEVVASADKEVQNVDNEQKAETENEAGTDELNEDTEEETNPQKPKIEVSIENDLTLSGFVPIVFDTSEVTWVEVFARSKYSLTSFFLGNAQKISPAEWHYLWQTNQTPNGEYEIYARTKSEYGFMESDSHNVNVHNDMNSVLTVAEEANLETFQNVNDSLVSITDDSNGTEQKPENSTSVSKMKYVQSVDSFVDTLLVEAAVQEDIQSILTDFRVQLSQKVDTLKAALRTNNDTEINIIKTDIESLKNSTLLLLPTTLESKEIITQISTYLSQVAFDVIEVATQNERYITEQVGDAINNDSDLDTISDYDELTTYKSNPFVADSDGDGYLDGIEIEGMHNPLDSANEVSKQFDSPKESEVATTDVLSVSSIGTLTSDATDQPVSEPKAIILGKGIPNSFVTLYIFSTPIVATVKTDGEGNWNYILNKELENGTHEIYVGMTNNEGKIISKSDKFSFVKTANAYEPEIARVSTSGMNVEDSSYQLHLLYLVASVAVASLGLVLILLGLHRHKKDDDFVAATQ